MFRKLIVAALVLTAAAALITLADVPARAEGEQVIAPGDILSIIVLGEPDLSKRVVVDAHGKITLPLANEVEMGGQTTTEAAARLRNQLTKYLKNPQVTIEIAEAAKRMVVISGAVRNPGVYEIPSDSKLMAVLSKAGGQTEGADLSKITVSRGGQKDNVINVDLTEFISGAKPEANVQILAGDTIIVPEKNPVQGVVYVLGEVNQRGPVTLRQGMTFREAMAAAGGATEKADTAKVTIKHQNDTAGAPVDFAKAIAGDPSANTTLESGDTIYVPAMETLGQFTIFGPVARPGQYPVLAKMQVTDAIATAGGATERGNLKKVRLTRPTSTGKVQSLDIDILKITDGRAQNVAMQPGDTIIVGERKQPTDKLRAGGLLLSLLFLLKP